ncbi:tRNA-dihydrouridine(20/20a) synthase (DusA-like U20-specific dihydrouridine synthase) (U20-specific Dus) (tRNA-dihydrouridine synthase 2), partial [Durusdinium trenchii]
MRLGDVAPPDRSVQAGLPRSIRLGTDLADFVEELQRERPELELTLNGGICSLEEIEETRAKGLEVMVGRWAVQQPWAFADESARARGRGAILQDYLAYARRELQEHREDHLSILADPLRNLFAGVKKSGEYRRVLSEALSSSPREGGWDRFQTAFATALSHLPESAFE